MRTEEGTIHTQTVYQDDTHRLLLKKVWNKDLPSVGICMSNAGQMPSIYHMDYTTMFCINALSALGYGSCSVVNLFSKMTTKLNLSGGFADQTCPENEVQILKVAEECDVFVWAVGSIAATQKKVAALQNSLFQKLRPFQDKIHVISDASGKEGLHPLSPTLRNKPWVLVPFALPAPPDDEKATQPASEKADKNNRKKN